MSITTPAATWTTTTHLTRRQMYIPLTTPNINAQLPDCAKASCSEYLQAAVFCAPTASVSLRQCYCNRLVWPTACASACANIIDRSSVAKWYWELCPSQMDSSLGQLGIRNYYGVVTAADAWAIQTAAAYTYTGPHTGYDCYMSRNCTSLTTSDSPTGKTPVPAIVGGVIGGLVVALILILLVSLIVCWRRRNRRQPQAPRRFVPQMQSTQPVAIPWDVLLGVVSNIYTPTRQEIEQITQGIHDLAAKSQGPSNIGSPEMAQVAGTTSTSDSGQSMRELQGLLTCPICRKVLYNPITILSSRMANEDGCKHNFCGSCAVKHLRHNDTCPEDGATITGGVDNLNLKEIIDQFLAEFPFQAPSSVEEATMDAIYRPGQPIMP